MDARQQQRPAKRLSLDSAGLFAAGSYTASPYFQIALHACANVLALCIAVVLTGLLPRCKLTGRGTESGKQATSGAQHPVPLWSVCVCGGARSIRGHYKTRQRAKRAIAETSHRTCGRNKWTDFVVF